MARLSICEGYTGCWICLNKPDYALIISHYEWICLNNAEYDWICWYMPEKTRVLNMPELFWMCLMQYIAEGHCTNYWAVTQTETYSGHCQTFKMERSAKKIMPVQPKNFQGREGCGTGYIDKHFVRNTRKRNPAWKHFGLFSPWLLKLHFEWKI